MEFLAGLHPEIVHFPIALLVIYSVLEIIGVFSSKDFFSNAGYLILILGIITAVGAVLTGNQAEEIAEIWEENGALIPYGAISEHENYATITLWYYLILAVFRTYFLVKKKFNNTIKYAFIILSIGGVILLYETAKEGGKLVYEHGIGTDLLKPDIMDTED